MLANLCLYTYESGFSNRLIRGSHRRHARSFSPYQRYIDDFIVINNRKFIDFVKEIYPSELNVKKADRSDDQANYLDLISVISNNDRLYTKLYDKCDDFNFHIVDFLFMSSNVPSDPSHGVYISQLIRYTRCYTHPDDFGYRHKPLVDRLLSQRNKVHQQRNYFPKILWQVSRFDCEVSEVS